MAKAWQALAVRSWPDYLFVIALLIFAMVMKFSVTGHKHPFVTETLGESGYPMKEDTVPGWVLASFAWVVPVLVFVMFGALKAVPVFQAHQHTISFLMTYIMVSILSNAAKLQVGRPRPSFLQRCFQDPGMEVFQEALDSKFTELPYSTAYAPLCTENDIDTINNAYKSFPSGHASLSAASGMYLTLFLIFGLNVFEGQGHLASAALSLAPVSIGAWVGLTRISDNEHHPTDVLAGFVLGAVVASFLFTVAQRSLPAPDADVPDHGSEGGYGPGAINKSPLRDAQHAAAASGSVVAAAVPLPHGDQSSNHLEMGDMHAAAEGPSGLRTNPFS